MNEFSKYTAYEIGELIFKKEVSVKKVTEAFIIDIKKDLEKPRNAPDKVGAFISVFEKEAIAAAEEIQKKVDEGQRLSPFMGVPIAIKDCICTIEGTTSASSKILEGYKSPFDAGVIDKLRAAGMILLGKVNMDEFAMGGSTETSYYGVTRNPWDMRRVPGGSSGGSVAAVAAGLSPIALGSDTGGSIRQPCAFTNLTGVKPTYGSVSRYGLLAYGSSLDQIGPISKDVRDASILLSIISGSDKRDSTSVLKESFSPITMKDSFSMKGKKIGVPINYLNMQGIEKSVKNRIEEAAKKMEELGARIVELDLDLIDYAVPTYLIISCAEASSNLSRYDGVKYGYRTENPKDIHDIYYKSRSEGFGREVKRRIMLGSFVLSSGYFDAYYKKALQVRTLIKNAFDEALERCEVILSPVTPTVAYETGGQIENPLAMYLGDIYSTSVNLTGLPAVSIPVGFGQHEMPIGAQLIGKVFSEEELLSIAGAYQGSTDFHKKTAF